MRHHRSKHVFPNDDATERELDARRAFEFLRAETNYLAGIATTAELRFLRRKGYPISGEKFAIARTLEESATAESLDTYFPLPPNARR